MLQRYKRLEQSGKETASSKNLQMARFTLHCMALGGMHDHVGGGFHRYSVDEHWHGGRSPLLFLHPFSVFECHCNFLRVM